MMRPVFSIIAALIFSGYTIAADYAVGPTSSGNGSGSDWNNQAQWSTLTPSRGNTYYLADGSYADKLLQAAVSGTTAITIKKATGSEHGPSGGWSSTYGDGQAVFTGKMKFRTGYYVFDGATRDEDDWFDGSAYGFRINSNADTQQIKIGGLTSGGGDDYSGEPGASGVEIRHVYLDAATLPSAGVRMYAIDTEASTQATGIVISRVGVVDGNNHFFIRNTNGTIIEYCASENALNNSNNHGEIVNLYYNTPNAVVRYNHFRNNFQPGGFSGTYYAGTAIIAIVTSADCEIYGNLFVDNCNTDGGIGWYGTNGSYSVTGLRVYNNTWTGSATWGYQGVRLETGSSDCLVYNNLWVDCSAGSESVTESYNGYSDSSESGETNGQFNLTTSIFTDYAGGDYTLSGATTAGTDTGGSVVGNDLDMLGATRGSDGTWDRGAFEYDEGGDVTAPTVDSVAVATNGTDITVTHDESVTAGSGGSGGWSATGSTQGAQTMTYSSGDPAAAIVFTVPVAFYSGETVTLAYTQPTDGWEDASGNDLATLSGQASTNNSTQTVPTIRKGLTNRSGSAMGVFP